MSSFHPTASVVALSFALMLICCASFAADYYVATTAGSDTTGTGSQAAPWATIQHTINTVTGTASDPADIHVAAGTYRENLVMKDYVNLWGGYEPGTWTRDVKASETIIDGGRQGSCIRFERVEGGTVDGLTITNGTDSGIYCRYFSAPIIQNNTITGNWGDSNAGGGGIYCYISSPTVQNNTIGDNGSIYGGGIYCYGSSAIIQNNIIRDNEGRGAGGGIYCRSSSPLVQSNTISDNSTEISGGGIYCEYSSPTIQNNIICNNEAYWYDDGRGGGIHCENSSPMVENNVISGNEARFHGGGIYCRYDSAPTVENNVIANNLATYGGGIDCYTSSRFSPMLRNNKIIGNSARYIERFGIGGNGGGIYSWGGSLSIIENNLVSGNTADWYGGGIECQGSSSIIQNNTISQNSANWGGGGIFCQGSSPLIDNNAFSHNVKYDVYEDGTASDPTAYYNEFYGSSPGMWYDEGHTDLTTTAQVNALAEAEHNISVLPGFLPSLSGVSTSIEYDPTTFQSTVTDSSAMFTPGSLVGLLLNPDVTQPLQFPIVSNTATTITIWGDITGGGTPPTGGEGEGELGGEGEGEGDSGGEGESEGEGESGGGIEVGATYQVFDYHLAPSSALIDAGTAVLGVANRDIDGEARPRGIAFDIGADEYMNSNTDTDGDGIPDVVDPDDDNDGLLDSVETNTGIYDGASDTGTNPVSPDTDNDGLLDGVETNTRVYIGSNDTGTNPNDGDTDDDRISDGPLDPDGSGAIVAGPDPFPNGQPSEGEGEWDGEWDCCQEEPTAAESTGEPEPTAEAHPGEGERDIPVPQADENEAEEPVRADEVDEGEEEPENGGNGEGENQQTTPTPPTINLCPAAGTTASTTLAAKLDALREWRDGLLMTRLGEWAAARYYVSRQ